MTATIPTISENRFLSFSLFPRYGLRDILISVPRPIPTVVRRGIKDSWLDIAYEQLASIGKLEHGWDSYGAAPPDMNTVEGAWNLLQSLSETGIVPKPYIYPARSGGVQLEWEHSKRYLEIELVTETEAHYFFSDPATRFEVEGTVREGDSLDEVLALIARVRG